MAAAAAGLLPMQSPPWIPHARGVSRAARMVVASGVARAAHGVPRRGWRPPMGSKRESSAMRSHGERLSSQASPEAVAREQRDGEGEARREGGKGPRLVAAAEEDWRRGRGAKGTGEEERVIGCSTCGGEGFGGSGVIDGRD
jgi:hypothetical protein